MKHLKFASELKSTSTSRLFHTFIDARKKERIQCSFLKHLIHNRQPIYRPTHNYTHLVSERRTRTICRRPSVCRLSVCLSVHCSCSCSVCSCTLLRRFKYSAMFLRHLVRRLSANVQLKFYGDRPRGTPLSGS